MKRYALFMYDQYYPGGGWSDFEGSFDSVGDVRAHVLGLRAAGKYFGEIQQVIDLATGEDVTPAEMW